MTAAATAPPSPTNTRVEVDQCFQFVDVVVVI
jgi:hypothetical protein